MKFRGIGLLVLLGLAVGCSGGDKNQEARRPLTEHERDSVLAGTKLPGAGAVGKALEVADSASVRANQAVPGGD